MHSNIVRKRERAAVEIGVTVGKRIQSRTVNLSSGGMFVQADKVAEFSQGHEIDFELNVPTQGIVKGKGIVRWIRAAKRPEDAGIGIEFTELDPKVRVHFEDLSRTTNLLQFLPEAIISLPKLVS